MEEKSGPTMEEVPAVLGPICIELNHFAETMKHLRYKYPGMPYLEDLSEQVSMEASTAKVLLRQTTIPDIQRLTEDEANVVRERFERHRHSTKNFMVLKEELQKSKAVDDETLLEILLRFYHDIRELATDAALFGLGECKCQRKSPRSTRQERDDSILSTPSQTADEISNIDPRSPLEADLQIARWDERLAEQNTVATMKTMLSREIETNERQQADLTQLKRQNFSLLADSVEAQKVIAEKAKLIQRQERLKNELEDERTTHSNTKQQLDMTHATLEDVQRELDTEKTRFEIMYAGVNEMMVVFNKFERMQADPFPAKAQKSSSAHQCARTPASVSAQKPSSSHQSVQTPGGASAPDDESMFMDDSDEVCLINVQTEETTPPQRSGLPQVIGRTRMVDEQDDGRKYPVRAHMRKFPKKRPNGEEREGDVNKKQKMLQDERI